MRSVKVFGDQDLGSVCGRWLVAPNGTNFQFQCEDGKDAFNKSLDKWWDGYNGESCVVVRGLDKSNRGLAHEIRTWGDAYYFLAECRRSTIQIRPKCVIVISPFYIDEIWADKKMRAGLHRRFNEKREREADVVCADHIKQEVEERKHEVEEDTRILDHFEAVMKANKVPIAI